jgi:MATE family multidrug resistance protein
LNVILNGILIFGWLGGVEWGLTGGGIATFISRLVMFLLIFGFVFFDRRLKEFRGSGDISGLLEPADPIFRKLGLPGAFQFLFEVGAFSGAGLIMGWFGAEALAAHQIALNVASVTFMIALGFSLASAVMIGEARGLGNPKLARTVALSALRKILIYASLVCAVLILARQIIPSFYTSDPKLIAAASTLLIIAGLFQFFDCTQVVLVGALRGYKDTVIPTWITLFGYWGLALPMGYWLGFPMQVGPIGVWLGLASGLAVVALSLGWRFHHVSQRELSVV